MLNMLRFLSQMYVVDKDIVSSVLIKLVENHKRSHGQIRGEKHCITPQFSGHVLTYFSR